MYQADARLRAYQRLVVILIIAGLCLLAYRIYSTIRAIQISGTLTVQTQAPDTQITVTSDSHQAAYIGKGDVRARLQPGRYQVGAKISGIQAIQTVTITRGATTNIKLNPSKQPAATASAPTGFINFDTLVDGGLSSSQESYIENMFSTYKPNAQVIKADESSISVITPDPTSNSTTITMNFDVSIDTIPYHATLQYSDLDSVQMTLFDAAGNQVYQDRQPSSPDR